MDNTGGTASTAEIFVTSGTHAISAPVGLAEALTIVPSAGTTLAISGVISNYYPGVAESLTLAGPGALILSASNTYSGGTTVTSGTLMATTAGAIPDGTSLTVGAGGASIFGGPAQGAAAVSGGAAVSAVPEPGTLLLLTIAGIAAAAAAWRKRRASIGSNGR